ncbi:hypothetical protein [Roseovarius sp. M141]|uniref:hypothetical protein n=1 Tax=Roseovarius sp. M141 TaxID=2583806 RepID=UPI0020CE5105|nr:hypothetical protein [Roseovarius sp. M141]MCQ0090349.1 hypothetical protein [Roseovarius sp. M141]
MTLRARHRRSPLLVYLAALLVTLGVLSALAEDSRENNQPGGDIAVQQLSFARNDQQALNIARQMYGRDFPYVKAIRVWLETPNDDPEQLFLKIGKSRNCKTECFNVALFHNEKWLEIYRRPAVEELGLSAVTPTGMRSIVEDGRVWTWSGQAYTPQPDQTGMVEREANEAELALVSKELGANIDETTATSFGPPEVSVYEVEILLGGEKIIVVRSPYYCGQSFCPVFLINNLGQSYRMIQALEGVVGLSRTLRDENGFRGIETLSRGGVTVISPSTGAVMETIPTQPVAIAGTVK